MAHSSVTCLYHNAKLLGDVAVHCFLKDFFQSQRLEKSHGTPAVVLYGRSLRHLLWERVLYSRNCMFCPNSRNKCEYKTWHCHTQSTGGEDSSRERFKQMRAAVRTDIPLLDHLPRLKRCSVGVEVHLHTLSISVVDGSNSRLPAWRKDRLYVFQFVLHQKAVITLRRHDHHSSECQPIFHEIIKYLSVRCHAQKYAAPLP